MGHFGLLEILLVPLILIPYIAFIIVTLKKLLRSKIPENQKITWLVFSFFFQIVGLAVFMIYHDFILSLEYRAF